MAAGDSATLSRFVAVLDSADAAADPSCPSASLEAAALLAVHVGRTPATPDDILADARDILARVGRKKDLLTLAAQNGEAHLAVEAANQVFVGPAGIRVLREASDLSSLSAWLLPALADSNASSSFLCALLIADALAGIGVPVDLVAAPTAAHHLLVRTKVMDEDLPGLETVCDPGYPWFFAADLPGAPPEPLRPREVAARLAEAASVVARGAGDVDAALRALQLQALSEPSMGVVRDVGMCLAARGLVEDAKKFLDAYLNAATDREKRAEEYREAESARAALGP